MQIYWCAWNQCLVAWHSFNQALAVVPMASHLSPECFDMQRSSQSTQWLQGAQVSCWKKDLKPSPFHCHDWPWLDGVSAEMLCLVFIIHGSGLQSQPVLPFSYFSTGHCSRSLAGFFLVKPRHAALFFLDSRSILLSAVPNKPQLFSFILIVLS